MSADVEDGVEQDEYPQHDEAEPRAYHDGSHSVPNVGMTNGGGLPYAGLGNNAMFSSTTGLSGFQSADWNPGLSLSIAPFSRGSTPTTNTTAMLQPTMTANHGGQSLSFGFPTGMHTGGLGGQMSTMPHWVQNSESLGLGPEEQDFLAQLMAPNNTNQGGAPSFEANEWSNNANYDISGI